MADLLAIVLPVFLVIFMGYGARWRGLISDSDTQALMLFAQGIAIPVLLFRAMSQIDLRQGFDLPLLGSFYAGALAGFGLGMLGARMLGRDWPDCVAIGFCGLFSNSLLMGVAITERAYGAEALTGNFSIVALHSPICYGIGITAMELVRAQGSALREVPGKILGSLIRNPLIMGIGLGMLANLLGVVLPVPVADGLDMLVRAALPAALFGMGGILFQYRPEGDLRIVALICVLSLGLHPAIAFGLGHWWALDQAALRSAVLTGAMAPGINAYIFANMYGVAKRVAATAVLVATALSVLSAAFWLAVLP